MVKNDSLDYDDVMVSIKCMVFNHEVFLRDCLEGIISQKTSFKFEAIVHDDCSTDGSADIIREYAEKYPDIIKPILEEENLFSKHDGSIYQVLSTHSHGKYIAICEGDDYWIDPYKLQKQVDFLEQHSDYSMCCSRAKSYSQLENCFKSDVACYNKNQMMNPKDIIRKGGLFIASCSIVYRNSIRDSYPDYCLLCHVGDYPLQIFCAMKGKCYYFNEAMSVYRVDNPSSWVGMQNQSIQLTEKKIEGFKTETLMLMGFGHDYPKYKKYFYDRMALYLFRVLKIPHYSDLKSDAFYHFRDELSLIPLYWKINLKLKDSKIKYLRILNNYFFYHLVLSHFE